MKKIEFAGILVAIAVLCAGPALAEVEVDQTRELSAEGLVSVRVASGELEISGWDRNEVSVRGTISGTADALDLTTGSGRVSIEVKPPKRTKGPGGSADLEIRIPRGSRLEVSVMSADVDLRDHAGTAQLVTLSGDIDIRGATREVEVETASGDVDVEAPVASAEVQSVSGDVDLSGVKGRVSVSAVSGDVNITGELARAEINTTSGDIRFEGALHTGATVQINAMSGNVDLLLPASVSAEFKLSTFSGDISNQFGPQAKRDSEYAPGRSLTFIAGGGDARVEVQSFSGEVRLGRR
jgi:DUF4097 and DUF4098 domain-containing protein YvlB